MKFTEQIHGLISCGDVQEASVNILEDLINAVLGDRVSAAKIVLALVASPLFIREKLFWTKVEAFLNGVYQSEDDCAKLCAKLTADGEKRDNAIRLVESIDRADTKQKIQYLINVTRCLLTDFIDRPTYFRICHVVTHTLSEDLEFLGEHIHERDMLYGSAVQGLLASGLMYQSVIDAKGEQKYSFTPLAGTVDQYAVSYSNVERYPNPREFLQKFSSPQPQLPGIPEINAIGEEELEEMWNKA